MEALLTVVAFVVASAIGLMLADRRRQRRLHAWRLAARRVGLADVQDDDGRRIVLGRSGGLSVRLEQYSAGESERGTRIVAATAAPISPKSISV